MSGIFWVLVVIAVLMFVAVFLLYNIENRITVAVRELIRIKIHTRDLRHHVYRIETVITDRDFNDVRTFDRRDHDRDPMWDDE